MVSRSYERQKLQAEATYPLTGSVWSPTLLSILLSDLWDLESGCAAVVLVEQQLYEHSLLICLVCGCEHVLIHMHPCVVLGMDHRTSQTSCNVNSPNPGTVAVCIVGRRQ